jgi:catechol 2,3-dioxygenase-like lactoylglutathione lyase family enzyme
METISILEFPPLRDATVYTALPALDLDRAKQFFRNQLGLVPAGETESTVIYQVPEGHIVLFLSNGKPSGEHTQIGWVVADIATTVAELRQRGVVFVEYDYPDFKTIDGIATFGENRYAWFLDTEGNMHGVAQFAEDDPAVSTG